MGDTTWDVVEHGEPLEEAANDPATVLANALVNGSHDAGEAQSRHTFGSPSPVASNHYQTSGIMDTSQQGPSSDIDSASVENGDAERSPSASNSLRYRTSKRVLRPATGQALRPSMEKSSHRDGQPQPVASASLGPVHSSKVSKATGKKRPGPQRRPNASQEMSPADSPLLSSPDTVDSLPQIASIPPRRSKRMEPPEPSTAKGLTGITSTDSLKGKAQSRPKRNFAGNPISMV